MDDRRAGRARRARRWILASTALASSLVVVAPAQSAVPLVRVDQLRSERGDDRAVVTARVAWNADGARADGMVVGDLRLVAVSDHGHRPTLLSTDTHDVDADRVQDVRLVVTGEDRLRAMRSGNRVVLTASQHAPVAQVSLTTRTFVTVAELQPFGSRQPHVGTEDCSDTPIQPGAILNLCDLVGADLDGALVSEHDPKSDEGRRPSRSTRLMRADLTGATMVRADVSGATVAGGRLNGTDLTRGKLDNLSLAGAEAVGLIGRGATSDKDAKDSGANLFAARLTEADLRDTQFNGVSFARARLNGARLQGARWQGVLAEQTSFRDANLTGASLGPGSSVYFADFTDAVLAETDLSDIQLTWALLCRTELPQGSTFDARRDCRDGVESATRPAPNPDRAEPYVSVAAASIDDGSGPRTVRATVRWDAESRGFASYGMSDGDIRLVAIDGRTGRPTLLDQRAISGLPVETEYELTVSERDELAAMRSGNRIVLTATQHPPFARFGKLTERSYVTVRTLQRGRERGRVGQYDCARIALTLGSARAEGLSMCDLAGATLSTAGLAGQPMRFADLTGAAVDRGGLTGVILDGAALGGLEASGATFAGVSMVEAFAAGLRLPDGVLSGSRLLADSLDDVDLRRTKLYGSSTFAGAPMRGALLSGATLDHADLAFTDLAGARLDDVTSVNNSSLFLGDLSGATLEGSTWTVDEAGELPWTWATLCGTVMPRAAGGVSGDRDCGR